MNEFVLMSKLEKCWQIYKNQNIVIFIFLTLTHFLIYKTKTQQRYTVRRWKNLESRKHACSILQYSLRLHQYTSICCCINPPVHFWPIHPASYAQCQSVYTSTSTSNYFYMRFVLIFVGYSILLKVHTMSTEPLLEEEAHTG